MQKDLVHCEEYLTIIPLARMGSESIAHEVESSFAHASYNTMKP